MAGGRLSEVFAPRLGVNLLWLVPAVAIVASLLGSVVVFAGTAALPGDGSSFLGGLLLSLVAAMVAVLFVLVGLVFLALPLTFVLRAAKMKWLVVVGIAVVSSIAAGALFGMAQEGSDFLWVGIAYSVITALTWLLALRRFAEPIQPADIDAPLGTAA